ncbi:MAG: hypothetical protein MHM6MM_006315 [Cercozoa sp. M6MM]
MCTVLPGALFALPQVLLTRTVLDHVRANASTAAPGSTLTALCAQDNFLSQQWRCNGSQWEERVTCPCDCCDGLLCPCEVNQGGLDCSYKIACSETAAARGPVLPGAACSRSDEDACLAGACAEPTDIILSVHTRIAFSPLSSLVLNELADTVDVVLQRSLFLSPATVHILGVFPSMPEHDGGTAHVHALLTASRDNTAFLSTYSTSGTNETELMEDALVRRQTLLLLIDSVLPQELEMTLERFRGSTPLVGVENTNTSLLSLIRTPSIEEEVEFLTRVFVPREEREHSDIDTVVLGVLIPLGLSLVFLICSLCIWWTSGGEGSRSVLRRWRSRFRHDRRRSAGALSESASFGTHSETETHASSTQSETNSRTLSVHSDRKSESDDVGDDTEIEMHETTHIDDEEAERTSDEKFRPGIEHDLHSVYIHSDAKPVTYAKQRLRKEEGHAKMELVLLRLSTTHVDL